MGVAVIDGNGGTDQATVKPGSTAAVAADKPLVITAHPSSASLPVSVTGGATSANQTNGSQKTQVVDGSGNVQNAGDAAARALFEKITDGTNTAAVKAASTAALATDPALVVAVSPNNTIPISAASLPLPTGAAAEHTTAASPNSARLSDGAAFYDAAKTGQLPAALVGGRLDENVGAWLGSTTPTVGQKTMAASLPVAIASDQTAVPISAASLPLPTGAATAANQTTLGSQTTKLNDGTNTAAVKAASTAPVAADPALVVSISPNSTSQLAGTPTEINVAQNAASVTITASASTRSLLEITNTSPTATLWIFLGATAFVNRGIPILPMQTLSFDPPFYAGQVTGIWSAAGTGAAVGFVSP